MNFEEVLMERISEVRDKHKANCIGTALYLAQESENEVFRDPKKYDIKKSGMIPISEPKLGAIVVWHYPINANEEIPEGEIFHMGVVTSMNPILITHRNASRGLVIQNQPIGQIWWAYIKEKPKFYLPKKLQEKQNVA